MHTLKINNQNIELGISIDIKTLAKHKFNKSGFIFRLVHKSEPNQIIWWSKNCDISCFDNKFRLYPMLDKKYGHQSMFGTSGYLFFKNNYLEKVTFQLIGNELASNLMIENFSKSAIELYGQPENRDSVMIWYNKEQSIIAEKKLNSANAYFHWIIK